ncbi:MAG: oligosaccharide flippase family protein [Terrisporobacter sp.]|uniref:oligosaccharide flippase family protein n=1 Tax=Terrisporobacter sp. TaxID=1965305 RepID=UPI002FC5A3A3
MKRNNLIINVILLTLSTMILGFISMGFRVYLSNKIGSEGMGLFQLIMSINIVCQTLAISGIRVTMTRVVAEELGKGNNNLLKNIVFKGLIYTLFFSICTGLLLFNSAEFISTAWIQDIRAIIPLKILSCALPFVGISCCLNGYFYGCRKVVKSISADIIETVVMITIVSLFITSFSTERLDYTCAFIAVGTAIGNIFSAFYAYVLYILDKKNMFVLGNRKSNQYPFNKIFRISIPIAFSAYIQTILKALEDILIPKSLRLYGSSSSTSLSIFGMVKGMAMPLLAFPSIFLASFSTLIIPEIAEANALNKNIRVNYIISKVIKFTLILAIFATGLFMFFSDELGSILFNSSEVSVLLKVLAPLIPFMYLDKIVDGSLNALDMQVTTLKINIIDMFVRISAISILIPRYGIKGFILVLFLSTTLNTSLGLYKILKVTKLHFKIFDWIIKPTLSVILSSYATKIVLYCFHIKSILVISILLNLFLYFIMLILFKALNKKDLQWFINGLKKDVKTGEWDSLGLYKQI